MNYIFLISFIFSSLLIFVFSKVLHKVSFGQAIRALGPKNHYSKAGTPNIGGVFICFTTIIFTLYYGLTSGEYKLSFMLVMPMLTYSILGFVDDIIKAKTHKNDGLSPRTKMIFQIVWAVLYYIVFINEYDTTINLFGKDINISIFYGFFILLSFISSSNAYNLCDGLDGLATGLAIIILCGLLFLSDNSLIDTFIVALIGSLTSFLVFNIHPARIFMGDSGSLAIGVTIANLCILLKVELLLIVFGFIMILETLSVIIQVIYFKITKGKRIFLMTPIHHHFELKGYKEEKISIFFWLIQFLFVLLALYVYKKYY